MSESNESQASPPKGRLSRQQAKIILAIGAVLVVALIIVYPKPKVEVVATETPPVNVTIQTVVPIENLADTFTLPAVIEPNRTVDLTAEISGRIERLGQSKGRPVQKGDLLVELNTDLLHPELTRAKAQLKRHQTEFARMTDLVERKATSRSDLDNAAMDLAMSVASVEEIQARLERSRITAPCDGILNDLLVEVGEYVQPGTPVAQIVETQTVKAVVDIPERDIAYFSKGQTALVLIEDQEVTGTITYISSLADQQTRTTRMEITLDNTEGHHHSGQVVRVQLTRRTLANAMMIPLLAVIPMEDSKAVYVVKGNITERREVEIGMIRGDQVQIHSGLQAGDQLIVSGHRFIAPGQKVKVIR